MLTHTGITNKDFNLKRNKKVARGDSSISKDLSKGSKNSMTSGDFIGKEPGI